MLSSLKKLLWGRKDNLNQSEQKFRSFKEKRNYRAFLDITKVHPSMEEGLVSVVLPVYNGEKYLAESVESVLGQTYGNFELIIIDDGSMDKTGEIAKKYADSDPRIRVITQENQKIPKALSRGFNVSNGEFLTWTSADNIMDNDFLELMVEELRKKPKTAMVWANMRLINSKGRLKRCHGWYEKPFFSGNVILPQSSDALNTHANNTIGAAFMYRRVALEVLGNYSPFRYTLEDYDYWMRMNSLLEMRHVSFRKPIYSYRWHRESLTASDKKLKITQKRERLMTFDDFRREFFLFPLPWYVVSDKENQDLAEELKNRIIDSGDRILRKEDFDKLFFGKGFSNLVCVSFGNTVMDVKLPPGTVKVGLNIPKENAEKYDFSAKIGVADSNKELIFDDVKTAFAFIDSKARNEMLCLIEEWSESTEKPKVRLSVVVCTQSLTDEPEKCIEALCRQTAKTDSYEIIVVNGDFRDNGLKEFVQELGVRYENVKLSYVTAPVRNISYEKYCGAWASGGENLFFVDDRMVVTENTIEEILEKADKNVLVNNKTIDLRRN